MPDTNIAPALEPAPARLTRLPPAARLLLRGDKAELEAAFHLDLPAAPCTAHPGERSALWLGPDEWLVIAPADTECPDWDADRAAAIDISHRQVAFRIDGDAAAALAIACPLDLAPAAFPVGACTRTVFGKAEIILWRPDGHSFHLETWRSFAPYVEQLLAEGIGSIG